MQQHKAYDKEMGLQNEKPIMDTFILPNDVCNVAYKRTKKLWQKHKEVPMGVSMWV
jgi:hypothetical protein